MFRLSRGHERKQCRVTVMRVGFLFNHYAVHQVPHAAPYAFELSRNYPDIDVVIAQLTQGYSCSWLKDKSRKIHDSHTSPFILNSLKAKMALDNCEMLFGPSGY